MKLKLIPNALMLLLVVLVTSCSKKSNVPVPEDAAVVVHIDGASLSSKLSWDEIKQSEWYRIANEKTKDSLSRVVLNDPEASGIDIKSDMYVFVKMQGKGSYTAVIGNVKDEKAFANFMSKSMEGKTPTKEGDISVIRSEKSVLTWKGNRFVMIADSPEANASGNMMGSQDYENRGFPVDSLVYFANQVYNLDGKKSLGNNERFADMLKEKGDAHFWINTGSMYGGAMPAMLALTKANLLFKDNVTAATLNFDNGKITVDGKSYYNKELEALYKKYSMKNMDESMLKMIPSQNVAAVFAMNYPPEGLKEFVSLLGLDGLINMFLAEDGFTLDDFIRANKGDILFSVSDFGFSTKPVGMDSVSQNMGSMGYRTRQSPEAKFLFATSVNDKAAFQKMMDLLRDKMSKEGGPAASAMMGKIPYQLKDNWFIAGNDSAHVFSYGAASVEQPFLSLIKGHPMGGYIDIQKFINGFRPTMDSTAMQIADQSLKTWQDIVFYGGEFKNNSTLTHMEINMVDKNTNSLKQLNNYISFIATKMDEIEKRKDVQVRNYEIQDSIAVPRPADVPKSNQ